MICLQGVPQYVSILFVQLFKHIMNPLYNTNFRRIKVVHWLIKIYFNLMKKINLKGLYYSKF